MDQAYIRDPNKITGLSLRDEFFRGRRPYNPNFRRGGRRENYKDFDEPENEKTIKTVNKPMINYLDIWAKNEMIVVLWKFKPYYKKKKWILWKTRKIYNLVSVRKDWKAP